MKDSKGFSLVELIIVAAIFSIISGAIYAVMSMGRTSYQTGDAQISVQQEARKAMHKLTAEIREASSVNIGAAYPFTIGTEKIKYEVVGGQLQKTVQNGATTILANNVSSIQFTLLGGDMVYMTITTQKNTWLGRTLRASVSSQVNLRN